MPRRYAFSLRDPVRLHWSTSTSLLACSSTFSNWSCASAPAVKRRLSAVSSLARLSLYHLTSWLRSLRLNLKRRSRQLTAIRLHRNLHPQSRKRTSYHSAGKVQIRLRPPQSLFCRFGPSPPIHTHATERLKALVRQDEDAAVVCFQVVDGFAEEECPEVFADEFDAVEGGLGPRAVGAESTAPPALGRRGSPCCLVSRRLLRASRRPIRRWLLWRPLQCSYLTRCHLVLARVWRRSGCA